MGFHDYPGSTEPGFVTALNVMAPVRGHVVLYDLKHGAFPALDESQRAMRWLVVYRPGRKFAQFKVRREAREAMTAIANLDDKYGLLPPFEKKVPEKRIVPPLLAAKESPARGRDAAVQEEVKPPGPEAAAPSQEPKQESAANQETVNFHLEFKRLMTKTFAPEVIVGHILSMLNATRTVATRTDVYEVPDYAVRERGVRMAVEFTEGKAKERPDVKEVKKVSYEEIRLMFISSPAARRAFRKMLDDAEAKATLPEEGPKS